MSKVVYCVILWYDRESRFFIEPHNDVSKRDEYSLGKGDRKFRAGVDLEALVKGKENRDVEIIRSWLSVPCIFLVICLPEKASHTNMALQISSYH